MALVSYKSAFMGSISWHISKINIFLLKNNKLILFFGKI